MPRPDGREPSGRDAATRSAGPSPQTGGSRSNAPTVTAPARIGRAVLLASGILSPRKDHRLGRASGTSFGWPSATLDTDLPRQDPAPIRRTGAEPVITEADASSRSMCQHRVMAVRRTDIPTESDRLGYTRLFRDDLEKIARLLMELGDVFIVCDNLEATAPSDLSDPLMPERPRNLVMESSNGEQRVRVEVGRGVGKLTIENPNTLTEGIRAKINEICHGSAIDALIAGRAINTYVLALFVPAGIVLVLGSLRVITYSAADISLILALVVWMGTGSFIFRFREKSDIAIINAYRADKPSFFRRTRDEWVVEVSVMLLGLLLGYFIGHLTR
jgi:hypothetical protein